MKMKTTTLPYMDTAGMLHQQKEKNPQEEKQRFSNAGINLFFCVMKLLCYKSKTRQIQLDVRRRRVLIRLALGISPIQAILKSFRGKILPVQNLDFVQ
jgi:hypothetical protein